MEEAREEGTEYLRGRKREKKEEDGEILGGKRMKNGTMEYPWSYIGRSRGK